MYAGKPLTMFHLTDGKHFRLKSEAKYLAILTEPHMLQLTHHSTPSRVTYNYLQFSTLIMLAFLSHSNLLILHCDVYFWIITRVGEGCPTISFSRFHTDSRALDRSSLVPEWWLFFLFFFSVQCGIKIDEVGTGDEVERSVIRFNHCVVLYHLHQYRAALALLEKMYTGLESLGNSFFLRGNSSASSLPCAIHFLAWSNVHIVWYMHTPMNADVEYQRDAMPCIEIIVLSLQRRV